MISKINLYFTTFVEDKEKRRIRGGKSTSTELVNDTVGFSTSKGEGEKNLVSLSVGSHG
jgi:hypothetical protein